MRRQLFVPCLAFALVVPITSPAVAQDMTGTWVLGVTLDAGSGDATFVFKQEGEAITGAYSGTLGEQTVTGTVKGNVVEFSFTSEAGKITYKGTVEDGVFKGTCEYGLLGGGTFSGEKTAT